MKCANRLLCSLIVAVSAVLAAPVVLVLSSSAAYADAVRPEVGKPLQEAQALIKSQRYKEAVSRLNEADAVGGKTANESYLIALTRFSLANTMADAQGAAAAMEAILSSGRAAPGDRVRYTQAVAVAFYRDKDYPKAAVWTQRYLKEGGSDPAMRQMLVQSYYLSNDCVSVSRELQPSVQAAEGAARPGEEDLQMLLGCYERQGDKNGIASALERLVTYYPKKDYWANVLSRTRAKPGFSDRLDLDLDRIRFATGNLTSAADLVEMAQLALEAGNTAEAKKVVDQGFANGLLGQGADGDRHKRLRDLVTKQLADDQKSAAQRETDAEASREGSLLVSLGFSYAMAGQADKGIAMMERGIARNDLKHPDDAKLHLGIAYLQAGKKNRGREILRTVRGADGTQDVARLWMILSGGTGA